MHSSPYWVSTLFVQYLAMSGRSIEHALAGPCVPDDTAYLLIASLDKQVSRSSWIPKGALLRDKVMFITAPCVHLYRHQLLALEPGALAVVNYARFSFWDRIDTTGASGGYVELEPGPTSTSTSACSRWPKAGSFRCPERHSLEAECIWFEGLNGRYKRLG
jgi:hypothetical protein